MRSRTIWVVLGLLVAVAAWTAVSTCSRVELPRIPSIPTVADAPAAWTGTPVENSPDPPERTPASVLEPGATSVRVAGRVLNLSYPGLAETEEPAGGVAVSLKIQEEDEWGAPVHEASTTTDGDGSFAFDFEDPGPRPLQAQLNAEEDDLWRSAGKRESVREGERTVVDAEIRRAAHGSLEGETVDRSGRPLAGVRVLLRRAGKERADLEAASDERGRFRIEGVRGRLSPRAELPGHVLLEAAPLRPRQEGGWEFARIVLAPSGTLAVRVVEAGSRPVPGARVFARTTDAERSLFLRGWKDEDPHFEATTGPDGLADFARIWSGARLRVTVDAGDRSRTAESMAAGRLLFARDAPGASPIVVPTGASLELVADISDALRIRGRVSFSDGRPAPKPNVSAREIDLPEWEEGRLEVLVEGDEEGRYEIRLSDRPPRGRLLVFATDRHPEAPPGASPAPRQAVAALVDPAGAEAGVIALDLVLASTGSITGRVVDAGGNPVRSHVRAAPSGSVFSRARTAFGIEAHAWTVEGGAFEIAGLPEGNYDLYASEELGGFYSFALAQHRFPDVATGTRGLELRLGGKPRVRIRVHAAAERGEPKRMIVLHGKLFPRERTDLAGGRTPRRLEVDGLVDWPVRAPLRFTGIGGERNERGEWEYGFYDTTEVRDHDLPPMEEGWYVIGVQATDAENRPFFPVATGPVWLEAGEYEFAFRLVRTATVEGRVLGASATQGLAVSLRDAGGRAIPLRRSSADLAAALDLAGDGSFRLHEAPVGAFRFRIGTPRELREGRYREEIPLEIAAEENPPIEILLRDGPAGSR